MTRRQQPLAVVSGGLHTLHVQLPSRKVFRLWVSSLVVEGSEEGSGSISSSGRGRIGRIGRIGGAGRGFAGREAGEGQCWPGCHGQRSRVTNRRRPHGGGARRQLTAGSKPNVCGATRPPCNRCRGIPHGVRCVLLKRPTQVRTGTLARPGGENGVAPHGAHARPST